MAGTLFKPWRAYEELDGLSDTECREMIERRWRREVPPLRTISAVSLLSGLIVAPGMMFTVIASTSLTKDPNLDPATVYTVLTLISVGAGVATTVLLRWVLLGAVVRRTLRRIVAGAVCPRCGHALRGLPIIDDATRPNDRSRMRVRCPECGKLVRLLKHGYGPEDLAPWEERVLPKGFEVRVRE